MKLQKGTTMIRSGEKILVDIDATLDQLIENAATMNQISLDTLLADEMQALQRTQESLLARLVHMNDLLEPDEKRSFFRKQPIAYTSIENKIVRFGRLNAQLINQVKKDLSSAKKPSKNEPKIRKNRKRVKVPC